MVLILDGNIQNFITETFFIWVIFLNIDMENSYFSVRLPSVFFWVAYFKQIYLFTKLFLRVI